MSISNSKLRAHSLPYALKRKGKQREKIKMFVINLIFEDICMPPLGRALNFYNTCFLLWHYDGSYQRLVSEPHTIRPRKYQ